MSTVDDFFAPAFNEVTMSQECTHCDKQSKDFAGTGTHENNLWTCDDCCQVDDEYVTVQLSDRTDTEKVFNALAKKGFNCELGQGVIIVYSDSDDLIAQLNTFATKAPLTMSDCLVFSGGETHIINEGYVRGWWDAHPSK